MAQLATEAPPAKPGLPRTILPLRAQLQETYVAGASAEHQPGRGDLWHGLLELFNLLIGRIPARSPASTRDTLHHSFDKEVNNQAAQVQVIASIAKPSADGLSSKFGHTLLWHKPWQKQRIYQGNLGNLFILPIYHSWRPMEEP